jgi:DNA-binding MarR family transcriptional regulator
VKNRPTNIAVEPDLEQVGEKWTAALGGRDVSNFLLAASIQRLSQHIEREFVALAREERLGPGDVRILLALRRTEAPHALRPADLFRQLFITSGAVSKQVDRLAERGLVRRTVHSSDTRIQLVCLETSGKMIAERLMEQMSYSFCGFETLAPKDQQQTLRILSSLLSLVSDAPGEDAL